MTNKLLVLVTSLKRVLKHGVQCQVYKIVTHGTACVQNFAILLRTSG